MKAKNYLLPSLGLGLAFVLAMPAEELNANFSLTGESLGDSQRDFRVFDNFADSQANNNTNDDPMYPGQSGAELAIWKGVAEWGSTPHGDGTGDPVGGNVLGSGGANFDGFFAGIASGIGNTDNNIVSTTNSCSPGVLAFALLPASNGWQIRFCDSGINWADGPGGIGGGVYDIQGIMTHEYGHVLGLGHSCNGAATMRPSGAPGQTALRSINSDDVNGIQAVYGARSATKPAICETSVSGSTLTLVGANFSPTNNEVWFTNANVTGTGADPRVRVTGVSSTLGGTRIDVTIPGNAMAGDVMVKVPGSGGAVLSNAFPTDLVTGISALSNCPLILSAVTPDIIPALQPGTDQTVTLTGSGFSSVTTVLFNLFETVPSSSWTIVDDFTITVDVPQHTFLGPAILSVSDGTTQRDIGFTIEQVASPQLQLGTGDDFNQVAGGTNMPVVLAGVPGRVHRIYYSMSPIKSIHPLATFCMGNNFTDFVFATAFTIGANGGFTESAAPVDWTGPPTDFYCQSVDMTTFEVSNLQIITLVP